MSTANSRDGEVSTLRIEGEMTIYRALELKQLLLARLEESAALEVDLAAVTELDSSGVQLLLLAKRESQARQRELRLVAHSPQVLEVFDLLNLNAHFGDPLLMSPQPS